MIDEKTIVLDCSNCRTPLISIMKGKEGSKHPTKIRAKCPHCGDQSYIKTIEGKFFLGSTDHTYVESTEESDLDSVVIVHTIIANKRNRDD